MVKFGKVWYSLVKFGEGCYGMVWVGSGMVWVGFGQYCFSTTTHNIFKFPNKNPQHIHITQNQPTTSPHHPFWKCKCTSYTLTKLKYCKCLKSLPIKFQYVTKFNLFHLTFIDFTFPQENFAKKIIIHQTLLGILNTR